jgi:hypothetical protein
VLALIRELNIRVITEDGALLRELTLDPSGTTNPSHNRERCPETTVNDVPRHHTRRIVRLEPAVLSSNSAPIADHRDGQV